MKIKNKKKSAEIFLIVGILAVMLCSLVIAGVSNPYATKALEMYPGEIKDVVLTLQNLAGDTDVTYTATIIEGSEIASLKDKGTIYLVPLGANNIRVTLKVEVPETAGVGSEYLVMIQFDTVSTGKETGGGTGASIVPGLGTGFTVKVIEKPELPPETPQEEGISAVWWILGIVAVIVVIVVLWFITKNMKDSSAEKSKAAK